MVADRPGSAALNHACVLIVLGIVTFALQKDILSLKISQWTTSGALRPLTIPLPRYSRTQAPLRLMTNEEKKIEFSEFPTATVNEGSEEGLESQTSSNNILPNASQASVAEKVFLPAVTILTTIGALVTGVLKGSKSQQIVDSQLIPRDEEPVENLAVLNLLWYMLSGMLVTLLAGLAYEVYRGPLRAFILHDTLVSALAVISGVVWVRMFRTLASEGIIGRKLSRKLIHITSAPLFLLCWPLYSAAPTARCIAAIPPLANSIRLLSAGLGKVENQDAVQAISRQGGRKELLQGPLYYVLVLLVATVVGWRTSLASYVSISLMAGGDGLADIVGRRFGGVKLPWNSNKSWAGSLAMFIGGFALSMAFVSLFGFAGFLPPLGANAFPWRLAAVCLLTTIVESL
eukprot:EG_transcript_13197